MKLHTPHGIVEVLGDQPASARCYVNYLSKNERETLAIKAKWIEDRKNSSNHHLKT